MKYFLLALDIYGCGFVFVNCFADLFRRYNEDGRRTLIFRIFPEIGWDDGFYVWRPDFVCRVCRFFRIKPR